MSRHARTGPPPPAGPPTVRFRPGDRVTHIVDMPDGPRRLVGDVTDSNTWLFTVRWLGGEGVARFAHCHEPERLRHATPHDERDALHAATRATVAAELARLAETNTRWPTEVRQTLRMRALELSGSSR